MGHHLMNMPKNCCRQQQQYSCMFKEYAHQLWKCSRMFVPLISLTYRTIKKLFSFLYMSSLVLRCRESRMIFFSIIYQEIYDIFFHERYKTTTWNFNVTCSTSVIATFNISVIFIFT